MALVVIKQPETLNYSGNPISYTFESTTPAENVLWVSVLIPNPETVDNFFIRKEGLTCTIDLASIVDALAICPEPGNSLQTIGTLVFFAEFTTGEKPPIFNNLFTVKYIKGAYTKIEYAKGLRALDQGNFLTGMFSRPTTPAAKTFLHIASKNVAPLTPIMQVLILYTDGTQYLHPQLLQFPDVLEFETATIDISWDVFDYGNLNPAGGNLTIKKIELTFNFFLTITLRPIRSKWQREFHWVNQLGGLDSAIFTGAFKTSKNTEKIISEHYLPADFDLETPQYQSRTYKANQAIAGNSGYMLKEECTAAAGILTAPKVWERIGNEFIPVLITEGESLILDDQSGLYYFEFSYKYAFDL